MVGSIRLTKSFLPDLGCVYVTMCQCVWWGGGGGGEACAPHMKLVTSMPPNVTRVTTEEEIRCQNNI